MSSSKSARTFRRRSTACLRPRDRTCSIYTSRKRKMYFRWSRAEPRLTRYASNNAAYEKISTHHRFRERAGDALSHRRHDAPQEDKHRIAPRGGGRPEDAYLALQDRDHRESGAHRDPDQTNRAHRRSRPRGVQRKQIINGTDTCYRLSGRRKNKVCQEVRQVAKHPNTSSGLAFLERE